MLKSIKNYFRKRREQKLRLQCFNFYSKAQKGYQDEKLVYYAKELYDWVTSEQR